MAFHIRSHSLILCPVRNIKMLTSIKKPLIASSASASVATDLSKTQPPALPMTINCKKIYNHTRGPEVMLEIRQKIPLLSSNK